MRHYGRTYCISLDPKRGQEVFLKDLIQDYLDYAKHFPRQKDRSEKDIKSLLRLKQALSRRYSAVYVGEPQVIGHKRCPKCWIWVGDVVNWG